MSQPLTLIHGGGEMIGFLQRLIDAVRAGEIETIAIAAALSDGGVSAGLAFKQDAVSPFPRTLGAVANLQHALLTEGLSFA